MSGRVRLTPRTFGDGMPNDEVGPSARSTEPVMGVRSARARARSLSLTQVGCPEVSPRRRVQERPLPSGRRRWWAAGWTTLLVEHQSILRLDGDGLCTLAVGWVRAMAACGPTHFGRWRGRRLELGDEGRVGGGLLGLPVTVCEPVVLSLIVEFERFAATEGRRLRTALVAAYGPEAGADAASEALAYGWEHWSRMSMMENPSGYLFRVGQTAARRSRRKQGFLPPPPAAELPDFEPRLLPALESLSESQRVCVVLIHAFGWSQVETATVLGVDTSTVRTHLARGLARLKRTLEVADVH